MLQTCKPAWTAGQFDEASRTWTEAGRDASWAIPADRVQLVESSPTKPFGKRDRIRRAVNAV